MTTVRAVLFDLDGTLVDSLPEIHSGVCAVCHRLNVDAPSKEAVASMIGRGVGVLVERLKHYLALSDSVVTYKEMLDLLVEEWSITNGEKIEFFPGVLNAIQDLRKEGIRTALVTNKLRTLTEDFLKIRKIEKLFDAVVCGDDCDKAKPAPDMLIRAMKQLGVTPEETLMVGDSRNDALAARAAGVKVALVETGYNEGMGISEWAREAGFSRIYPNTRQVCRAILSDRL